MNAGERLIHRGLCAASIICAVSCTLGMLSLAASAKHPRQRTVILPPSPPEAIRATYLRGHSGLHTAWVQGTWQAGYDSGKVVRSNSFHQDLSQPAEFRWSAADYEGSGWDIGHLWASADATGSRQDQYDSFALTNTMPQDPALNRGQWARLEAWIRERVKPGDTIITGPAFLPDKNGTITIKTIGEHRLHVPTHCWKAVLFNGDTPGDKTDTREAVAWLIPNHDVADFEKYRVSVDELEAAIGWDLFPGLDEKLEERRPRLPEKGN